MHIVRRVLPTEYDKYRKHLKALDDNSRHLRFTGTMSDSGIDIICDKIDAEKDKHVLFAVEDANLDFIAVAHIAVFDDVELAFSVLPEHQGEGIGDALMNRVVHYCRVKGLLKGHMMCLPNNGAMRHLCTKYGIKMHNDYGDIIGDVELRAADLQTIIEEAGNQNLGVLDFMAKRTMLPWTILSH